MASKSFISVRLSIAMIFSLFMLLEVRFITLCHPNDDQNLKPQILEYSRKIILESQWIQFFPHIKHSVLRVSEESPSAITSANKSVIKVSESSNLHSGGLLNATILAYNEDGERKRYGGDFFLIVLRRPKSKIDGVSCNVRDNMDGSYSVSCILPWSGEATLEATLVHPSEALYQIMKQTSSERAFGYYHRTEMLNSKNETEFTICAVGFRDKRPDELCNYSNPTHGEKRICLKPKSGECSKIVGQNKVSIKKESKIIDELYFRPKYNLEVPINGSGKTIVVHQKEASTVYLTGDIHKYAMDPMTPSGWFFNSKWKSIKARGRYLVDKNTIAKCIGNRRVYFFGDSTARNIYRYFIKTLSVSDYGLDNRRYWSRGRDADVKNINATLQYRSHGAPMTNPGPDDARPYMSDSFDAIKVGGSGTIVIFTIGYHFEFFDPDVYVTRLKIIKSSVISLLSRLPGVKVIIKGLHYLPLERSWRSSWLTYRLEILFRHEFSDLKDVLYMENWDITLLLRNKVIHPSGKIFDETIRLLLAYMC